MTIGNCVIQCIEFAESNMPGGVQHITDGAREEWYLANKKGSSVENMIENLAYNGDVNKLYEAIGKAMSKLEGIPKNKAGRKGNQTFKYAPYHVLRTALLGVLGPEGVSWIQPMHTDHGKHAHTLIVSGHGASVISTIHFEAKTFDKEGNAEPEDPQEVGRVSTYMRRYQLQSFFGLEGDRDFDDDETSSEKKTVNTPNMVPRSNVPDSAGQKVVEKVDKGEVESKPSEIQTEAVKPEPVVSTLPKMDVKSANAKIYDCMKQLKWSMTDFAKYCEEKQDQLGEFHGPAKMTVDQKNMVINLLVTEKGCAPF